MKTCRYLDHEVTQENRIREAVVDVGKEIAKRNSNKRIDLMTHSQQDIVPSIAGHQRVIVIRAQPMKNPQPRDSKPMIIMTTMIPKRRAAFARLVHQVQVTLTTLITSYRKGKSTEAFE